ncbi:MAG: FadR family transcriptional regulator [Caldilineaceae bacterium]|nr:FadR family transcriptional regulator [Caldilineaceae bacterium]
MAILRPLSRDTLTKQAADTLRRFILSEGLRAGDALPSERELSEILSVSRNIVREALTVLVSEGLITKKPGSGIFVTDFDPATVTPQIAVNIDYDASHRNALSEARAVVELGAVELMVSRITAEQLNELERINQGLTLKLQQNRSSIRDDIDFHTILFQATHNQVLMDLIPLLVEHFRLSVAQRPAAIRHNPARIAVEHQQIIDGLRNRDVDATRRALLAHLDPPGTSPWRQKSQPD